MERAIEATTSIRATLDQVRNTLRDDPVGAFTTEPPSPEERRDRMFRMAMAVPLGDAGVDHDVLVTLGRLHASGSEASIPLSWTPVSHEALLPSFEGELHAVDGVMRTSLVLGGTYDVPLGGVGRFGDGVLGRRLARRSLRDLLDRVAHRLDADADRRQMSISYGPAPYNADLRERPFRR